MSELSVPPRFSLSSSQFLYDPDLPDHLYRTYARITGLAWQRERAGGEAYDKTPAVTIYELAIICGLSVRTLWRQIEELVDRGLLTYEVSSQRPKRMIFYPVWPDSDNQGWNDGEIQTALAEFGVDTNSPLARQVATLPHVTAELIRTWGMNLRQRPGIHNLPGLLLHVLRTAKSPPEETIPEGRQDQPLSLDDDLRQALCDLGWSGNSAWSEVADVIERKGSDFVWSWVRYVQDHPDLGAGFLRTQLRGSTWPQQGKSTEERRQEQRQRSFKKYSSEEITPEAEILTPEAEIWRKVQADLKLQMTQETYNNLLSGSVLVEISAGGRAVIGARRHATEWLQNRLYGVILRTLSRHTRVTELVIIPIDEEGK